MCYERPTSIFRVDGSKFFLSDGEFLPGSVSYPARHCFSIRREHCPKDDSIWRKHQIIYLFCITLSGFSENLALSNSSVLLQL